MAATLHLTLNQGETFAQRLTIKAPDGSDLVGVGTADLVGQIRANYDDPLAAAEFSFDWVDHDGGIADMSLDAVASAALPAGSYLYDVELHLADGVVIRLLEGKLKHRAEVTKNA